jgi:hypothetical protein
VDPQQPDTDPGEITDTGSCGGGPSGDGLQLFTSLYDEDEDVTWMFQISIPQYDGPGEYEVGDSLLAGDSVSFDDTSITFSNNAGGEWGSTQSQGGQVVVNADEVSGTVDVTVVAEDGSSEIHLSGAWTCTRGSRPLPQHASAGGGWHPASEVDARLPG